MSPERTGVKRPGMAIVERMAVARSPLCQTLACPVYMSVATQTKGIGREKKSRESA